MRKAAQILASLPPVRFFSILIIGVLSIFSRVLSNLKFKALIPNSKNSICHYSTEIKYGNNITIGNFSKIGKHCSLGAKSPITIGDHVTLSRGVIVETAALDLKGEKPYKHYSKPIVIEDGVWLAANVIVLAGVTIKKNALIGAGTVITKNVEEGEIIVGARNRSLS
ncbi:acyltransferase [Flavobacteriaceae bacterium S0825]|uniref:acyltransferase n=1 Tax=Gaetbulibacter sp. S0825 TaxID=2720084 RepID=UPI001430DDF3|nr:acyltransferase [Gaetbulibacter sp. S0825]MCK0108289.1 acyltransferase [Flavobacteriaceae bacterium S0825]NIX63925.1 acyltransferase [Gaetbulibacter sp. S0825]